MEIISKNQNETYKFAKKVAKDLVAGDVLALYGDLGSGKTTFVKGLALTLGIQENITSPTFVIEKRYKIKNRITNNELQITNLVHIDCYRIESDKDAFSAGILESLKRSDAIVAIEWADKIENILPKETKKITFEYIGENKRKIVYSK